MDREVPHLVKRDIILDEVIDGMRYVIRRDSHNWILQLGSPDVDDERFFQSSRTNSYFTSFDALLRVVYKNLVKDGITHLDEKSVLVAYYKALNTVEEIASKLDAVSWGALDRGDYCPNSIFKFPFPVFNSIYVVSLFFYLPILGPHSEFSIMY